MRFDPAQGPVVCLEGPRGARCYRLRCCVFLAGLLQVAVAVPAQDDFIRGDINIDGHITLSDASALADAFMPGAQPLPCLDAADVNDDGFICLVTGIQFPCPSDYSSLLNWLHSLSPLPDPKPPLLPPPFPFPGPDPTGQDNFGCADGSGPAPPPPQPGFKIDWEHPPALARGDQAVEFFFKATAARKIDGFSLAYLVNLRVLEIVDFDFEGTILPPNSQGSLRNSLYVSGSLSETGDPDFVLLRITVLFVTGTNPPQRIPFAATQGAVSGARLLRLLFNVRPDAPVSGEPVALLKPYTGPYPGVLGRLGGLLNVYVGSGGDLPIPEVFQSTSVAVVNDAGELLFIRGDANGDRSVDISDALFTLNFLFTGGSPPAFMDSADADDNGALELTDPVYLLGYLFRGGPPPPPPFPGCGRDPTLDTFLDILGPPLPPCPP